MRPTTRLLLALLAAVPALVAWRPLNDRLTLAPQSRLWVDGTSTVRKWTCKAGAFETDVEAAAGAVEGVLAGRKAVRAVTVTVPTARLDCANGTMNEHMLKALKAKDHPTIEFRVASYDVARAGDGVKGTLTGALTLGGVTRNVSIPAEGRGDGAGGLRVTGFANVRMTEFALKPPTLMMGTLKVGDEVKVGFDLQLKD